MAITAEEIMQSLDDHRAELVAHMVEEAKKDISYKINWAISEEISKLVREYIKDEIGPEIKSQLTENKPVILKAVILMADELTGELVKAMLADAKENLSQSYKRSEILKKLFD